MKQGMHWDRPPTNYCGSPPGASRLLARRHTRGRSRNHPPASIGPVSTPPKKKNGGNKKKADSSSYELVQRLHFSLISIGNHTARKICSPSAAAHHRSHRTAQPLRPPASSVADHGASSRNAHRCSQASQERALNVKRKGSKATHGRIHIISTYKTPHPDRALEVPMAPKTQKLEPEYLRGFETKSRPPVASPPTPPITASRARSLSLYGLQIVKQPREKDRRCV